MSEIYPVVHVYSVGQAVEQSGVALEEGADGLFLIDHQSNGVDLLTEAFNRVSGGFPEAYVGLNFLTARGPRHAFNLARTLTAHADRPRLNRLPDGLWVDDAIGSQLSTGLDELRHLSDERLLRPEMRKVELLGGVAFKYTTLYTEEPEEAAYLAKHTKDLIDVPTTSGAGTGYPPTLQKIAFMKQSIGDKPLAVASGIDATNLSKFAGYIDRILVASSIETHKGSGEFVKERLRELIDAAKS